jgi:diguanylate cyclase (GGDEF)-like protein/PAS domain S-box-containing protein
MTSAPSRDEQGMIAGGIAVVQDITARCQVEASLQQQLQFADALNRIAKAVVEHDNPDAILDATVKIAGSALAADRALIYDISFQHHQAIALCEWLNPDHPDTLPTKATYPLSIFIGGATEIQQTRQLLISQADAINPIFLTDGSAKILHHEMHIRSLLWYPLAFRGDDYHLLVLNQLHARHTWTSSEISFLHSVSQQVSVALEKIRLMNERKQSEHDLRIAAIAFESQEGMLITDANSIILRANSAFINITGFDCKDVVGQNPRLLNSGRQDANFYKTMWQHIHNTGTWEGEIWNRRKSGEIYPEHLSITAVKDTLGIVTNYVATFNDITASKAAENEIKSLAFYDPLTSLPNRRLLMDRLNHALASSARSSRSGAVLFIDLDNFKTLNDTLGHDIGDLLLKQVSARLLSCVREGDTVARLGGDEFVVMLEDLSEHTIEAAEQTETVGEKILATLNQPYQLSAHACNSTPSIGATLFNDHVLPIEDLMKQADIAMYQAKKAGRNTLRFFDPEMQQTINTRAALESELHLAIKKQQFHLYYQIQVDSLNQPLGAETLIRWIHPERGMISPAQFIPLAEETGLILPIGLWVLDSACAQIKTWQSEPLTCDLVLAVNVSARQFRQADFVAQVQEVVARHAINPGRLKLELTESLLLDNVEEIISTMNALKEIGVRFSLDDFGTGYSSLQYLKRLPLDQLKIDQSFVRDIVFDNSDRAIVRTIIAMAQGLNLDVIAEGVETEEQRQLLLNKGCTHFQGYLFGRPTPIDQFETALKLIWTMPRRTATCLN